MKFGLGEAISSVWSRWESLESVTEEPIGFGVTESLKAIHNTPDFSVYGLFCIFFTVFIWVVPYFFDYLKDE